MSDIGNMDQLTLLYHRGIISAADFIKLSRDLSEDDRPNEEHRASGDDDDDASADEQLCSDDASVDDSLVGEDGRLLSPSPERPVGSPATHLPSSPVPACPSLSQGTPPTADVTASPDK